MATFRWKNIYAITHCPITYRDVIEDPEYGEEFSRLCHLVSKTQYVDNIANHINSDDKKYILVLTASRQGLGTSLCSMLVSYRKQISQIVYSSCNRTYLQSDLIILLGKGGFQLENIYVSNEFSHTNYNNTMVILS